MALSLIEAVLVCTQQQDGMVRNWDEAMLISLQQFLNGCRTLLMNELVKDIGRQGWLSF